MTSYIANLICHVVEGKDMPKMDMGPFSKSDLFVEVQVEERKRQTKVIKKSLTPIWNEKITLPFERKDSEAVFRVYDQDGLSSNDLVGEVKVGIMNLKPGANDLWFTLPEVKGAQGKLHLVLALEPTIHVQVVGATDLPKSGDLSGKIDPYVVMTMGGKKYQTKHLKKTLNPNWREFFSIPTPDLGTPLGIKIYDKDTFKDDLVEEAICTLSSLKSGVENKVDLSLSKGGTLHLEILPIGF